MAMAAPPPDEAKQGGDQSMPYEAALCQAQQAMNRKVKFSNNWKKLKARNQTIHSRIGNAGRDCLHTILTATGQNHAMVCIAQTL